MIGIIPSINKTYEVYGDLLSDNFIEGKLYYDKTDGRVYYYSTIETRSNPNTGYYPIWNGKNKLISSFSNKKYFDNDVIKMDIESMSKSIDKTTAERIIYNQRRSDNTDILDPDITDEDNMFTQCIKGVIKYKKITMIDLIDMANGMLSDKIIENYYIALTKITFMRMDKWNIWIDTILHLRYELIVYKENKQLLSYNYPSNKFDTGIVKYDKVIDTKDDPYKKIIKIIMIMENINKNNLRSKEVDDYTVNNMMTTINGNKSLSAQLFSRFIRMAELSYIVNMYDLHGKDIIFQYKE